MDKASKDRQRKTEKAKQSMVNRPQTQAKKRINGDKQTDKHSQIDRAKQNQ